MGKRYRNFAEYLQDNYYNQIFDKIKSYAIQNRKNMRFASYMVLDASYIELEDINVRGVTFHGDSNHNISFRVSVEASITLKGFGRKCYEVDNCTEWFSVICYAHLMDALHDFIITDEAINKVPRVQYKEIPETEYDSGM